MIKSGLMLRRSSADSCCSRCPDVMQLSVLQIGAGWFPEFCAGAENVYYHLCQHLPDANVTVHGLVLGSPQINVTSGGRVRAFSPRSGPLATRLWRARTALSQSISTDRPDLIASHFALFTLAGLDKFGSVPLVVHFHGPWAEEAMVDGAGRISGMVKTTIERAVYKRANRFVVLSRAFGEKLRSSYSINGDKIHVIPGGVDCSRFSVQESQSEARVRMGWQTDDPIILSVRRLARRMGLQELIASMLKVRKVVPNARLLIAGKGPEEASLRKTIHDLDLQDSVELIGFVPDEVLPLAYRAANLSIVPSSALEGFGLSTAESLAAGTPVLVTPVGGLPETVETLEPRLVLSGADSDSLAKGLSDFLSGHLPLPSIGRCRDYAKARFDWPVIARQTRDLYVDTLS